MKFLIIILSLFTPTLSNAQNCSIANTCFEDQEYLKYKVYYNWKSLKAKAGFVSFQIDLLELQGKPNYHIKAIGKTYPFYNIFYKVYDVYETYIDTATLLPNKFVRDVNEGGFRLDHTYDFDRESSKVYTISKVNDEKEKVKDFEINDCTHDMLSVLYQMRGIDFSKLDIGDQIPVEVFLDNEFYQLSMLYLGKTSLNTKFGQVNCIKVLPKVVSGRVFKDEEEMVVYVSDDENKIPILIETPLTVGSVKVVLDDFKNLRNAKNAFQK